MVQEQWRLLYFKEILQYSAVMVCGSCAFRIDMNHGTAVNNIIVEEMLKIIKCIESIRITVEWFED